MKGDFTRDTFNPRNHFSRVLKQQGRVELDADWNEQTAIVLHYLQAIVMDIIGPQGGPLNYCGFSIGSSTVMQRDFTIGLGRYYVDGILCENDSQTLYTNQRDFLDPPALDNGTYLVYLDAWERHTTCVEEPPIKDVALGGPLGPDTATRAKIVCQVKAVHTTYTYCQQAVTQLNSFMQVSQARMRACARKEQSPAKPCVIPPDARYRGLENQLYRVEIHRGGQVGTGPTMAATFKWSRENGSVVFPILDIEADATGNRTTITLLHLGRDIKLGLAIGEWVEIVDDAYVLMNQAMPLLKVFSVDPAEKKVILEGLPNPRTGIIAERHPLLRRWDHKAGDPAQGGIELSEGAALIVESTASADKWLMLEDGVRVQFSPGGIYRTGDYWLIPARTATGDVEWPQGVDFQGNLSPRPVKPHGVIHHYAPLATLLVTDTGVTVINDCRNRFRPLPSVYGYQYASLGIGADLLIGPE